MPSTVPVLSSWSTSKRRPTSAPCYAMTGYDTCIHTQSGSLKMIVIINWNQISNINVVSNFTLSWLLVVETYIQNDTRLLNLAVRNPLSGPTSSSSVESLKERFNSCWPGMTTLAKSTDMNAVLIGWQITYRFVNVHFCMFVHLNIYTLCCSAGVFCHYLHCGQLYRERVSPLWTLPVLHAGDGNPLA